MPRFPGDLVAQFEQTDGDSPDRALTGGRGAVERTCAPTSRARSKHRSGGASIEVAMRMVGMEWRRAQAFSISS
jgi:hypothetical protein